VVAEAGRESNGLKTELRAVAAAVEIVMKRRARRLRLDLDIAFSRLDAERTRKGLITLLKATPAAEDNATRRLDFRLDMSIFLALRLLLATARLHTNSA
jgi:hypothetical protein